MTNKEKAEALEVLQKSVGWRVFLECAEAASVQVKAEICEPLGSVDQVYRKEHLKGLLFALGALSRYLEGWISEFNSGE